MKSYLAINTVSYIHGQLSKLTQCCNRSNRVRHSQLLSFGVNGLLATEEEMHVWYYKPAQEMVVGLII